MKKENSSRVSQMLASNKTALYILSIVTALLDIGLFVLLALDGIAFSEGQAFLVMAIVSIILLLVVVNSNFRFAYSFVSMLLLSIISLVFSVLGALFSTGLMINLHSIALLCAHGLLFVAVIFSALSSAQLGGGIKVISVILTLLALVCSVGFGYMSLQNGLYGQGGFDYRTVYYEYDELTDSYVASGITDTRGNKVNILKEYNGKPVTEISCKVLTAKGVEQVNLESTNVSFQDLSALNEIANNENLKILVDKSQTDAFKGELIQQAQQMSAYLSKSAYVKLYNMIAPTNLDENEVYITFDYTLADLEYCDYEVIPTYFAQKGSTFDLATHGENVAYCEDYDINDEQFLLANYTFGGKVIAPLLNNGVQINKTQIQQSITGVDVGFENIYAVKFGEDNDTQYEPDDSFKSFNGTGVRYILQSDHKNLLNEIEQREGFSLSWKYTSSNQTTKTAFADLKTLLNKSNFVVYPEWTLNAPIITQLKSNNPNNKFVYGDDVTLDAQAKHILSNLALNYEWSYADSNAGEGKTKQIDRIKPSQTGYYYMTVTTSPSSFTSLTATITKSIFVEVDLKTMAFEWTLPTDAVYSATDKTISVVHNVDDVIDGDTITFDLYVKGLQQSSNTTTIKNAGSYYMSVQFTNGLDELYTYDGTTNMSGYTITPYEVSAINQGTTFTYNGAIQYPTVSATGIGSDGTIDLDVKNQQNATITSTNAGSYTITITSANSNYVISTETSTCNYVIEPYTVSPSFGVSTFTYNGATQYPTASATGIGGESVALSRKNQDNGAITTKDAGTYTMIVSSLNPNYVVLESSNSCEYVIEKKEITFNWYKATFTYNGHVQYPVVAGLNGEIDGEEYSIINAITYENTLSKNVGSYTQIANISNVKNYRVTDLDFEYDITKKPLTVNWKNTTSLVYNARIQRPTAELVGVCTGDNVAITYSNNGEINAGDGYSISVSINETNYIIESGASTTYKINPKLISASWIEQTFTYNGTAQHPTAQALDVCVGDTVNVSYNNTNTINADDYTITAIIYNSNYTLANATKDYTINQKGLDLIWGETTFVYNGSVQKPNCSADGIVGSDNVGLNQSAPNSIDVGSYQASATITNTNYFIQSGASVNYTITAKEVTVTWGTDNEFIYDGNAHAISVESASGLCSSADFDNLIKYSYYKGDVLLGEKPTEVGDYSVVIETNNANYTLTGTLTKTFAIIEQQVGE